MMTMAVAVAMARMMANCYTYTVLMTCQAVF